MEWSAFLDALTGETGVIALLLFSILMFLNGKILPKDYVNDLKQTNKELSDLNKEQGKSLEILSKTSQESLELSRTILKIVQDARSRVGDEHSSRDSSSDSG